MDTRKTSVKSGPAAFRAARAISTASRLRFSKEPPQASVRRFVRGARNSLMRYPSEPMSSTPS